MTIQHLIYIPAIFLLGFLFGNIMNHRGRSRNDLTNFKTSPGRLLQTFIIFLTVFAITHMFEIPWGAKEVSDRIGGLEIFDRSPVFSGKEVYDRISLFPPGGILAYKRFTYTIDLIFPLAFFLFLTTLSRFVAERIKVNKHLEKALRILPFLWLGFDLLENSIIFTLLTNFPKQIWFLVEILGLSTMIKFGLLLLSVVMPCFIYIIAKKRTLMASELE